MGKNLKTWMGVLFVMILLFVILYIPYLPEYSFMKIFGITGKVISEPDWLPNYNHRKKLSISGEGGAGTNYQVKLVIGKTSAAIGEDFDLSENILDSFNDIRFTDNDGMTKLDYWIEKIESSGGTKKATVWVEVQDNLDSNVNIYVYYGNPSAISASSGEATFSFFDDFSSLSGGNPVLYGGDDDFFSYPNVFKMGSTYYMVYSNFTEKPYGKNLATSTNLFDWTQNSNNPVLVPPGGSGWDGDNIYCGDVILVDGTYYLYHCGNGVQTTGVKISTDLVNWIAYEDNPILPGTKCTPAILKEPDGITPVIVNGKYWMAYVEKSDWSVRLVYSTDLYNWNQYENNPIFVHGSNTEWDYELNRPHSFIKDENSYYIFFMGRDNNQDNGIYDGLGLAYSNNLFDWTKYSGNPVISIDSPWEDVAVTDPVIRKFDEIYYLFYRGGRKGKLGFATASNIFGPYTKYTGKWNKIGTPSVSDGNLVLASGDGIESVEKFNQKVLGARTKWNPSSDAYVWWIFMTGSEYSNGFGFDSDNTKKINGFVDGATLTGWNKEPNTDFHTSEVHWGTSNIEWYYDGILTHTEEISKISSLPIQIKNHNSPDSLYIDWVYVRKYTSPEPTYLGQCNSNSICEPELGEIPESCPADCPSEEPMAKWKFDDGPGYVTGDSSIYENDGIIQGASWSSDCISGSCLAFDGNNDYVEVSDGASLDVITKLTVTAWMKQIDLSKNKALITKWNFPTQGTWGLQTGYDASDELWIFIADALDDSGKNRGRTTDANLVAENWYHISFVYDGNQPTNVDRLKIYVNGLEKTLAFDGTIPSSLQNSAASVKIGKFGGSLERHFNGIIDEVIIYNKALSEEEIRQHYADYSCGNGICDSESGETTENCPADCGECPSGATETYNNGIDDDCDGLIDCQDPDCPSTITCEICEYESCSSSIYNWYCANSPSTTSCGSMDCASGYCVGNTPYTYPDNCMKYCDGSGNCQICSCQAIQGNACGNNKYCLSGSCINCPSDYSNCDLDTTNGCEVNLQNNDNNCGSCGNDCITGKECVDGVCQVIDLCLGINCGDNAYCSEGNCYCQSGYADCDGLWSTGCEVNINTDNNHCNLCENACSTNQQCQNGQCVTTNPCSGQSDITSCGTDKYCCAETCRSIPTSCPECRTIDYQCSGSQLICSYVQAGTVCSDDDLVCTYDQCDGLGNCIHTNKPSGTRCSEYDSCTGISLCDYYGCDGSGNCNIKSGCASCPDIYGLCGNPICSNNQCSNEILTGSICGIVSCDEGASGFCNKICSLTGEYQSCTPICTETNCNDNIDNDKDGLTDMTDSDCNTCVGQSDGSQPNSCSGDRMCCGDVCVAFVDCPECKGEPYICSGTNAICSDVIGPCTNDGLTCTNDVCSSGSCTHPIKPDYCLMEGECYYKGNVNPSNSCQECISGSFWSNKISGYSCDDNDLCTFDDICSYNKCSGTKIGYGDHANCLNGIAVCEDGFVDCDTNVSNGCEAYGECPECLNSEVRECLTAESCYGKQTCSNEEWGSCILGDIICTPESESECVPEFNGYTCSSLTGKKICDSCGTGYGECIPDNKEVCCPGSVRDCDTPQDCSGTQTCLSNGKWDLCNLNVICIPREVKLCTPIVNSISCNSLTGSKTCNECGTGHSLCSLSESIECCPDQKDYCTEKEQIGIKTCSNSGLWSGCAIDEQNKLDNVTLNKDSLSSLDDGLEQLVSGGDENIDATTPSSLLDKDEESTVVMQDEIKAEYFLISGLVILLIIVCFSIMFLKKRIEYTNKSRPINPKLERFIYYAKKSGWNNEQIRKALLENRWSDEIIKNALKRNRKK